MISIVIFTDYYLPGYKSGGPVRALSNLVRWLSSEFDFYIVTRDRDLGDPGPYAAVDGEYHVSEGAKVFYLSPGELSLRNLRGLVRDISPDVIYLNSFFSPTFTIKPLLLRRLGLISRRPVIVAPRGELSPGALALKKRKKVAYLGFAKAIRLYSDVIWQASSKYEEDDIRCWFGDRAPVMIASDLPAPRVGTKNQPFRNEKIPGRLKVLFLSRISRKKNLDSALEMLEGLEGEIFFDIYGPLEDETFWEECQRVAKTLPENIHVRYRGVVAHSQVADVMAQHDLLFLPTLGENFGYVILEALVAGCPVLISDRTPWRDLQDSGAGWDIPLEQRERFRFVLQQCVKMDAKTHRLWSRRAHAYAIKHVLAAEALEQNRRLFKRAITGQDC